MDDIQKLDGAQEAKRCKGTGMRARSSVVKPARGS
jgi:hypothetical protein